MGLTLAACAIATVDAAPRAQVATGLLEGEQLSDQVKVFRGIPYARPPVGELRWRPPQPAESWEGVRPATEFGPRSMQPFLWSDMIYRSPGMSEDCLYLNVWAPTTAPAEGLPVLVYFHGGGFRAGDGSEPRYDGTRFAEEGIVVVTVNYRLGPFGFLVHPELSAASPTGGSGNYGLMDQSASLRWVHDNIRAFGGDPSRVTIGGQSAGAGSVCAQVTSPKSRGLFAGVIAQSGSLVGGIRVLSAGEREAEGLAFARVAGAANLAALRAMSAEQILEAAKQPGAPGMGPVVDGDFFPEHPDDVYTLGHQARVPLLIGWTSAEVDYHSLLHDAEPTLVNYRQVLVQEYGANADSVLTGYPAASDDDVKAAATQLATDRFIAFGTWKWAQLHRADGSAPVYRYLFAQTPPAMRGQPASAAPQFGAPHSSDLAFAFGTLDRLTDFDWRPGDRATSETMVHYLVNFLRTENPNGAGLPAWPQLTAELQPVMVLSADSRAVTSTVETRYRILDWWRMHRP